MLVKNSKKLRCLEDSWNTNQSQHKTMSQKRNLASLATGEEHGQSKHTYFT